MEEALQQHDIDYEKLQDQVQDCETKKRQLNTQVKKLNDEFHALEERESKLESDLKSKEKTIKTFGNRARKLQTANANLRTEVDRLKQELLKSRTSFKRQDYEEMVETLKDFDEENKDLNALVLKFKERIDDLHNYFDCLSGEDTEECIKSKLDNYDKAVNYARKKLDCEEEVFENCIDEVDETDNYVRQALKCEIDETSEECADRVDKSLTAYADILDFVNTELGCEKDEVTVECVDRVNDNKKRLEALASQYKAEIEKKDSEGQGTEVEMARASNQIFVEPPSKPDEIDATFFLKKLKAEGFDIDFFDRPESERKLMLCSFLVPVIKKAFDNSLLLLNANDELKDALIRLLVLQNGYIGYIFHLKTELGPNLIDLKRVYALIESLGFDFFMKDLMSWQNEGFPLMETKTWKDPDLEQRLNVAIDDGTMMTNYDGDPTEAQSTRDGWSMEPTVQAPPPRAPRGDWGFAPRTVAAAMVPPYTSLPMTMRNNFRPVLGV